MKEENERSAVLKDLISTAVEAKQEEIREKKAKNEAAKKEAKKAKGDKGKKGDVETIEKLPEHPLWANKKEKKPEFNKILPELQKKSVRSGDAVRNIQNKIMRNRGSRRGR